MKSRGRGGAEKVCLWPTHLQTMPRALGIQNRSAPEFRASDAFLMVLVAHEANMENARLRQPLDPEFTRALGEAVCTFSILKWNAVWICERIL